MKITDSYHEIKDLVVMQEMLKDLMYELHNICEIHSLTYNIFGGTLLGAVRHKDIIPWDDDIDITMPRPDYDKLIKIISEEYNDKYTIFSYPRKNYIYPFAKFGRNDTLLIESSLKSKYNKSCLYIDIFPMDGIPDLSQKELETVYKRAEKYKRLMYLSAEKPYVSKCWWKKPFALVRLLKSTVLGLPGSNHYVKKQENISKKHSFNECDKVGFVSSWGWGVKGIIPKDDYLNRKLYKFGRYNFWGTADYDTSLSNWYGDYMTPPPENKRSAPHNYQLFVKK